MCCFIMESLFIIVLALLSLTQYAICDVTNFKAAQVTGTTALLTWDETPGATGYIVTVRRKGATDRQTQETYFNFVYLEKLKPLTEYEVNVVLAENTAETGKFYSFTTLRGPTPDPNQTELPTTTPPTTTEPPPTTQATTTTQTTTQPTTTTQSTTKKTDPPTTTKITTTATTTREIEVEKTTTSETVLSRDEVNSIRDKPDTTPRVETTLQVTTQLITEAAETTMIKTTAKEVDGGYTEWREWTACSLSCSGGIRSRIRTCTNPRPSEKGLTCIQQYGSGSDIETVMCNTAKCPSPLVSGLTVTSITSSNASISWSAVGDNTLYVVAYKELGSNSYSKFETRDTHALLMSLEPESRYLVNIFLDISEVQADDESKWMSFTTPKEQHQSDRTKFINDVQIDKVGTKTVSLSWGALPGVSRYTVGYKRVVDDKYRTLETYTNKARILYLRPSTSYHVKIVTSQHDVYDERTEDKLFFTNALTYKPAVPPDFEVTKVTNTTIGLTWSAVPDAQNYHIAYRVKGTEKFHVAFSSTTEKVIDKLKPLTEYEVKIQVGLSPYDPGKWSTLKLVKTNPGPPSAPVDPKICKETLEKSTRMLNLLICWQIPQTQLDRPDEGMSYAVEWCGYKEGRFGKRSLGCHKVQMIAHIKEQPYYQTYNVKGLPYGSSLWYEVSSYSSIGEAGGKVAKWYKVKPDPDATTRALPTTRAVVKTEAKTNEVENMRGVACAVSPLFVSIISSIIISFIWTVR